MNSSVNKPIVYLNRRTLEGRKVIYLFFKYHKAVLQRVKNNDWIKYDPQQNNYYVIESEQSVGLICDLFEDISNVNLRYLDYIPVKTAPSVKCDIKDVQDFNPLTKKEVKGVILIRSILINKNKYLGFRGRFCHEIYNELRKNFDIISFNKEFRMWIFAPSANNFMIVFNLFCNDYTIKLVDSLKIKSVSIRRSLLEQAFVKDKFFKSCPIEYLEYLNLNNYSVSTFATYHYSLLRFINSFKSYSLDKINQFTSDEINQYHKHLLENKGLSYSVVNQSVNAIKLYYKSILRIEISNLEIIRPKQENKLPKVFSQSEIQKILFGLENLKHKAIIHLIYSSGCRISEIQNLKLVDILFDRKLICIENAKGKKDRYTLLAASTATLLKSYIQEYKPKSYLFEGQFGEKYSTTSIRNILKKAKEKAGIKNNHSVHCLRHSFATHLLENGTDIRYIQQLLGHNSTKTTEIYTHITNKNLSGIKSPADFL